MMEEKNQMDALKAEVPQRGRLQWIGLRPAKRAPLIEVAEVECVAHAGLRGDRLKGKRSPRQVSLIQEEHLKVIESLSGVHVTPALLRRNLVVRGINLLALQGHRFKIGQVEFEFSEFCEPCERMEENLGLGGCSAMVGHGGILARVLSSGTIFRGDGISSLGMAPCVLS